MCPHSILTQMVSTLRWKMVRWFWICAPRIPFTTANKSAFTKYSFYSKRKLLGGIKLVLMQPPVVLRVQLRSFRTSGIPACSCTVASRVGAPQGSKLEPLLYKYIWSKAPLWFYFSGGRFEESFFFSFRCFEFFNWYVRVGSRPRQLPPWRRGGPLQDNRSKNRLLFF